MNSNDSFPSVEPPPHPKNVSVTSTTDVSSQTQKDSGLTNAMSSEESVGSFSTPVVDPSAQPSVMSNYPKNQLPQEFGKTFGKKKPKPLLVLLVSAALLIVVTLVMLFIRRDKPVSLVGTKGELTWWGIENDEDVVRPLIDEYESKNPNIKITYLKQSENDYRERLTNSLAQGKGPDIFEIHNSWRPMYTAELSTLPSNIITAEEYKNIFYPTAVKDFTSTDGIIAIPLEYDALTLFYNQDIFDSAAVVPPTTWDELSQVAVKLTQKKDKTVILQSGVALGITENVDYWQDILAFMILQNGSDLQKPNQKALDAISFYLSFENKLGVWNTSLPNSTEAFAGSKLAMLLAPASVATDIVKENSNLRFRTTSVPQLPKNNPTDPDYSYATYWAQAVWKRSRNSEVAWDFLKFLSTGESLTKMNNLRKQANKLEKAYPRREMAILHAEDKILGSVIKDAENAKSWYLHDKTNDGQTGINTQINNVYKDSVNAIADRKDPKKLLPFLLDSINTVLLKYTPQRK